MRGEWSLILLGLLADLAVAAVIVTLLASGGCYPKTCAADPNQPGCLGGLHDERPPK